MALRLPIRSGWGHTLASGGDSPLDRTASRACAGGRGLYGLPAMDAVHGIHHHGVHACLHGHRPVRHLCRGRGGRGLGERDSIRHRPYDLFYPPRLPSVFQPRDAISTRLTASKNHNRAIFPARLAQGAGNDDKKQPVFRHHLAGRLVWRPGGRRPHHRLPDLPRGRYRRAGGHCGGGHYPHGNGHGWEESGWDVVHSDERHSSFAFVHPARSRGAQALFSPGDHVIRRRGARGSGSCVVRLSPHCAGCRFHFVRQRAHGYRLCAEWLVGHENAHGYHRVGLLGNRPSGRGSIGVHHGFGRFGAVVGANVRHGHYRHHQSDTFPMVGWSSCDDRRQGRVDYVAVMTPNHLGAHPPDILVDAA